MLDAVTSGHFEAGEHRLPLRIYMDAIGGGEHVYNGDYLKFFERGRTDLFRLLEQMNPAMPREPYLRYMVVAVEQRFRRLLRLHDVVVVTTRIGHVGRSSCALEHRLLHEEAEAANAKVSLVFTGEDGRPTEQPRAWIDAFAWAAEGAVALSPASV